MEPSSAQAAAAAAAAQSRRKAELERQRIEADSKCRMEEVVKQAKFIEDRDAAASTLRGSTGVPASGGAGDSELRSGTAIPEIRGPEAGNPSNSCGTSVVDLSDTSSEDANIAHHGCPGKIQPVTRNALMCI
jgi:hypothetical protein